MSSVRRAKSLHPKVGDKYADVTPLGLAAAHVYRQGAGVRAGTSEWLYPGSARSFRLPTYLLQDP